MGKGKSVRWCLALAGLLGLPATAGAETLEVRNDTDATVCYVFVSPCDMGTWGPDILGNSNTLAPGARAALDINAGCWDLKAEDCGHTVLATRRLNVAGDVSWTLAAGATVPDPPATPVVTTPRPQLERDTARITVKNRSGTAVCYVYVSPCASDQWGDDVLEESVLDDGANARISVVEGCWDLKAEDCAHGVIGTRRGLEVNRDTNWTVAAPAPTTARITIKNRTGQTICYAYASPCESDQWGADILQESTLADGENAVVVVPFGCWDLRVEDCSNDEIATRRAMQVTRNTNWTVQ